MDDTRHETNDPTRPLAVGDRVTVPAYDDQPGTVTGLGRMDPGRPVSVLLDDEDEPRKFNVDEVEHPTTAPSALDATPGKAPGAPGL